MGGFCEIELNTCYNLVDLGSCFIVHSLGMGLFLFIDGPPLVCEWVNFSIVWPHTPVQAKLKFRSHHFRLELAILLVNPCENFTF